jgi:hypothetical protein
MRAAATMVAGCWLHLPGSTDCRRRPPSGCVDPNLARGRALALALAPLAEAERRLSSLAALIFGQPGFFAPRSCWIGSRSQISPATTTGAAKPIATSQVRSSKPTWWSSPPLRVLADYPFREFVAVGGLMSYGTSITLTDTAHLGGSVRTASQLVDEIAAHVLPPQGVPVLAGAPSE